MEEINESFFKGKFIAKKRKIDDILDKNEKILWKGCPKRTSYAMNKTIRLMPVALLWAIIDFGLLFSLMTSTNAISNAWYIIVPFFLIHLAPFWIWLYQVVKASKEMKGTYYIITDKRLLEIKGDWAYISSSIAVKDLKRVQLKRNIIDKMLFVGDIYLSGKNSSFVMFDIPNSLFMFSKLQTLCESKEKDMEEFYPNKVECKHCGSFFHSASLRCPNCGASIKKS